jgi:hypothetical protein
VSKDGKAVDTFTGRVKNDAMTLEQGKYQALFSRDLEAYNNSIIHAINVLVLLSLKLSFCTNKLPPPKN